METTQYLMTNNSDVTVTVNSKILLSDAFDRLDISEPLRTTFSAYLADGTAFTIVVRDDNTTFAIHFNMIGEWEVEASTPKDAVERMFAFIETRRAFMASKAKLQAVDPHKAQGAV